MSIIFPFQKSHETENMETIHLELENHIRRNCENLRHTSSHSFPKHLDILREGFFCFLFQPELCIFSSFSLCSFFILFIFGCVGSWSRHAGPSLRHAGSFFAACGLFVAARRLVSSCGMWVPEHVGSVVCGTQALQLRRAAQQLWHMGLVAPWHVGSQFPDQGLNLRPLHCKVDSLPLDHQGSPLREDFEFPQSMEWEFESILFRFLRGQENRLHCSYTIKCDLFHDCV